MPYLSRDWRRSKVAYWNGLDLIASLLVTSRLEDMAAASGVSDTDWA